MLQNISSKIKRIIALALIILMASSNMVEVFASSTATVNTSALLLRSEMSTDSTVLIAIPQGENIELEYIAQDWCRVKYGKLSGFVMRKYLIINDYVTTNQSPVTGIDLPTITTKLGDTGNEVLKLQKALNKIGYYNGIMDGSFGKQTEDSVLAFQKSMNLNADGVAGASTISAISTQFNSNNNLNLNVNYNKVNSISEIGGMPNTSKLGDKGQDVVKLQQALNVLGYFNGTIDGSFGTATETALKRFQSNRKMTVDGIAGPGTLYVIFGSNINGSISTQSVQNTVNTIISTVSQGATYNKVKSISEIGTIPNTTKLGDNGLDVAKLQQALNVLGYYNGTIDGNFGAQTENALKRFQTNKKLSADGVAGPGTLSIMFASNTSQNNVQNTVNTASTTTYSTVGSIGEIGGIPNTTKLGDSGIDVAKLQQALNVLGYYSGTIDGNFGAQTETALKRFQTNRKMNADGVAGPGTLSVIFGNTITGANTVNTSNTNSNNTTTSYISGSLNAAAQAQARLTITSLEDIGDTPATSKKGDVGIDVVKLQQALKVSGYYNGTIDGSYGEGTEKAIMTFQKKRSMQDDGIAGLATIRVLFGSKAANASSYVSVLQPEEVTTNNANTSDPNRVPNIDAIGSVPNTSKPGDSGEDVKKLQQALNVLGYYNGIIDSNYGEGTQKAVSAFQRKRGMGDDGIAGPSTIRILFGEKAANANTYVSNNPTTVVTSDEDMGDIYSIADIGVPATSKPGDKGEDVKKLQQALKLLSFYEGATDGSFGEGTKNALIKFQKKRGMNADGVAGPSTIRIIFGEPAANASTYTASNNNSSTSSSSSSSSGNDKNMAGINAIADIGTVPKTSKPGDYSTDVKKLQQALKLLGYFNGKVDSRYGETTKQAVIKFQAKKGMSEDGLAGATTIRLLFGKEAQNAATASNKEYKTEKIDWFNGGNRTIPKKATFYVKDVKTGKVFKAMRWSGASHLDCEPLTKEDTAIMKSIFGGYSWSRRAVLIKYNDHVYAGSMNGFPHGTQTIKNNGFEGHFCIHTSGSKTHGSNKVDSEHQNQVGRALRSTW